MATPTPPRYDREEWARELNEELPVLVEKFRRELARLDELRSLAATPEEEDWALRESYEWKIMRSEMRMADLRSRLTTDAADEERPR